MRERSRPADDDLATTRRAAGLLLLDRLPFALVVVDAALRPVIMNARAREALAAGGGLRLSRDALRASDGAEDKALRAAVAAATAPAVSWLSSATALTITFGTKAVPAMVLPEASADPLLGRRGLACIAFGEAGELPHRELLRAMYGFTEREVDLASALIAGQNMAEAARGLAMAMPTARTHLQRLMEKTGTRRQGELLRVLLDSAP